MWYIQSWLSFDTLVGGSSIYLLLFCVTGIFYSFVYLFGHAAWLVGDTRPAIEPGPSSESLESWPLDRQAFPQFSFLRRWLNPHPHHLPFGDPSAGIPARNRGQSPLKWFKLNPFALDCPLLAAETTVKPLPQVFPDLPADPGASLHGLAWCNV